VRQYPIQFTDAHRTERIGSSEDWAESALRQDSAAS